MKCKGKTSDTGGLRSLPSPTKITRTRMLGKYTIVLTLCDGS